MTSTATGRDPSDGRRATTWRAPPGPRRARSRSSLRGDPTSGTADSARAATRRGGHFRYEASVGAGLPVIQTLRNQLDTGDVLTEVEGVFSGTLAWLFNKFDGAVPFSQLVEEARALGYTEPDPRDDLSGMDVARKLVILAREAGCELSLEDVAVESLVPEALRGVSRDEFLARLHELDAPLHARLAGAASLLIWTLALATGRLIAYNWFE